MVHRLVWTRILHTPPLRLVPHTSLPEKQILARQMKRSAAASAAANHWANLSKRDTNIKDADNHTTQGEPQRPKADAPEIIEIDSDEPVKKQKTLFESPIHLLKAVACPGDGNIDTYSIEDLLNAKDLKETYQFNFAVDLELLLTFLPDQFLINKRKLNIVVGHDLFEGYDTQFLSQFNISQTIVKLPKYGSHHTKMMINLFMDNTIEIVIMSSNITKVDCVMTQGFWRSGFLAKGKTTATKGTRFQHDLLNYLNKYKATKLSNLVDILKEYNFDPVTVVLIASAPGNYNLNNKDAFGYGKLYNELKHMDFKGCNFVAQVSSIASPISQKNGNTSSVFTHLLCPLLTSKTLLEPGSATIQEHQQKYDYKPWIIFPTAKDVASCSVGFGVGQSIHFDYTGARNKRQFQQCIEPYLCKWNPSAGTKTGTSTSKESPSREITSAEATAIITGRERNPPHVKYYLCDNGDDFKSLKWVLMGSHNLSKQAWGGGKGFGAWFDISKYEISSYELSVLVIPESKLVPVYKSDFDVSKEPIRLPFKLPPTRYNNEDKPWSTIVDFGDLKDSLGQTYHGLNQR